MGYVIPSPARVFPTAAHTSLKGHTLTRVFTDDEEEESTPPSSPPAPVLRRGKFDDEEEDSDVRQPGHPCASPYMAEFHPY
jgi:hypothetical protein